jgi:molybdenum cofactor cytidylyltransferase
MIAAIILAAGQSKRMGQPKMLLPWGELTVVEHVITRFLNAGTEEVVLVTGGTRERVEQVTGPYPVRRVHNAQYATGEMLSSLQCGLRTLSPQVEAVLVGLGDQPQIQESSVRAITATYQQAGAGLVVPSYQRRRGHPWLVARPLWDEVLAMESPKSPRDFLNRHAAEIHYVGLDTPSILADLDTPEDYEHFRP